MKINLFNNLNYFLKISCPACDEFKPYWQRVGKSLQNVIQRTVSLNCYRNSRICYRRIEAFPQFSVFKDGKHIASYDDSFDDDILIDFIKTGEYLEDEFKVRNKIKWY